jgi:hypothetical protein
MSIAARAELCTRLMFQRDSQKEDLMNPAMTNTALIAGLLELTNNFEIVITAVRSDHHDDGPYGHAGGFAADLWVNDSANPTDYADAGSLTMQRFLRNVGQSEWVWQVGLAGSADTPENRAATGLPYESWNAPKTVFSDDGADHIHFGVDG